MDGPEEVYTFSTGSYSDYAISAVFITRSAAQAACDRYNNIVGQVYAIVEALPVYDEHCPVEVLHSMSATIFPYVVDGIDEFHTTYPRMPWDVWERPSRPVVYNQVRADGTHFLRVEGIDRQAVTQAYSDNKAMILDEFPQR